MADARWIESSSSMKSFLIRSLRASVPIASIALSAAAAHASVVRVVVESHEPVRDLPRGDLSRKKIAYERIQGVVYGEVDPNDRRNAIIQDVGLAPKNARGMVEYAASFTLLEPVNMNEASDVLVYEVVNRGRPIIPKDLSSGDVFLTSGWQGDIPFRGQSVYGGAAETIRVPIAKNADGSPITGPILLRFFNQPQGAASVATRIAAGFSSSGPPPLPVDLNTTHATLASRTFETVSGVAGGVRTVAPNDWSWGDCSETKFPGKPDPHFVCLRDGFDASRLYQLVYQGEDPPVLGLGLAAVRDVVSFFRHDAKDGEGWQSPLAGKVKFAIGEGASQSGNLLRTFLNLGFNEDEAGRKVFDGVMPTIAARQTPINVRFGVPGGASNLYEAGSDGAVWWSHWPDAARGNAASGLLDRCTATKTCPLIVELLGSTEFWTLRASPDFVGTDNARDIPLPANVRRYYVASTQHGGGAGGFHTSAPPPPEPAPGNPLATAACALPVNPNPEREIGRAILVALEDWVVKGTAPPPSVYPTLAAGTLVAANARALGFPAAPSLPRPDGIVNPLLVYGFGKDFNAPDVSGAIDNEPPAITGVIAPLVPRVDRDGNEVGGIHTVLQQAALGTYLGWNITAQGFFKGQHCALTGSYIPFAHTREEREAAHDSRLSLEERYGTHRGYVCAVRRAAEGLLGRRFLLKADADRLIAEADSSDVLSAGGEKPSSGNEKIAAQQCLRTR